MRNPKGKGIGTNGDMYCVARVENDLISAASIIDEDGNLNLFLPSDMNSTAVLNCSRYNLTSGIALAHTQHHVHVSGADYHSPCNKHTKYTFQWGYFDKVNGLWHDPCKTIGQKRDLRLWKDFLAGTGTMSNGKNSSFCPVLNRTDGSWIHLIGDSVIRQEFKELPSKPGSMRLWGSPENPKYSLYGVNTLPSNGGKDIVSFFWNFGFRKWKSIGPSMDFSQFVEMRTNETGEQGRVKGVDPSWRDSKLPDAIVFGIGYHERETNQTKFGMHLESTFKLFESQANERVARGSCRPRIFYMNNFMAAPELIPDKYSHDRPRRTFINEYWKNREILKVSRKYPSIQVIDFMAIELPFHDDSHRDAVHLKPDHVVPKLLRDALMTAIFS